MTVPTKPSPATRIVRVTGRTTIGSARQCTLRLPGLRRLHAVVEPDGAGRVVLVAVAGVTTVDGVPLVRQVLPDGTRVRVGDHELFLTLRDRPGPTTGGARAC
jgi:hypothetical protein